MRIQGLPQIVPACLDPPAGRVGWPNRVSGCLLLVLCRTLKCRRHGVHLMVWSRRLRRANKTSRLLACGLECIGTPNVQVFLIARHYDGDFSLAAYAVQS